METRGGEDIGRTTPASLSLKKRLLLHVRAKCWDSLYSSMMMLRRASEDVGPEATVARK